MPAANTSGVYALSITAANGIGSNATQNFLLSYRFRQRPNGNHWRRFARNQTRLNGGLGRWRRFNHRNAQTLNSQLATLNYLILLISRRVNDVEQHGQEKIANQNRERSVHHRLSRGPADADRAFAGGQSLVATNEYDEYSETKRF